MKRSLSILSIALLSLPAVCAGQGVQPKSVSKKSATASSSKLTKSAVKPVDPASKTTNYADLTIGELVGEDANRWSDKMATRAAVSGFVTQITKSDDGDTDIRICENPRIDGMDRARCIMAKCIPKLPCEVPQIGKPVTVKGITRYDAKVGTHWWEIHPIELIDK